MSLPTILMMRIEAVREPSVRGGRFTVVLEGGERLRLERSVVEEFGVFAGRELDDAMLQQIREANAGASARARAVRIVSASNVSRQELRRRLVQKGETEALADEAVQWLTDLKLLDDLQTAKQAVQSAVRKGYGAARIRQILCQKGIERSLWDAAMEDMPPPDGAIDRFLASRLKDRPPDEKELKRAIDALLRRGHRWSDIRPALQRYTEALDDRREEL